MCIMLIERTLYHSEHKLTGSLASLVDIWGFFSGDRSADSDSDHSARIPTSGAVVRSYVSVVMRSLISINN